MPVELYIDYSVLESIKPSASPKGLKGFTPEEIFDILKKSVEQYSLKPQTVVASYKAGTRSVEITRADLDRMMSELSVYKNNTDSILFAAREERLRCLENIVKTNLLVEEGLSMPALLKQLASERDYYKGNFYQEAIAAALKDYREKYFAGSGRQVVSDYEMDRLLKDHLSVQIDLKIETQSVLFIKQFNDIQASAEDRDKIVASFKGGVVRYGDIVDSLVRYSSVAVRWNIFKSSDVDNFMANLKYDIIFPEAYSSYLLALSKAEKNFKSKENNFQTYDEYRTYHLAQLVLERIRNNVELDKRECEDYFNANVDKFTIREGIRLSYVIFQTEEVHFFENATNMSMDDVIELIVGNDIASEIYTNEFFYKGHLPAEIENYLFGLDVRKFSKILPLQSGRFVIFLVEEKTPPRRPEFMSVYPVVHRMLIEEKKRKAVERYFADLYKKYEVNIKI